MTEAFERIAMAAAPVFLARGYDGVSLRALAKELGIQAASLYHHCPGGKRELYVRVLTTYLGDYRRRLEAARGRARLPAALTRFADWMLEHPPVDAHAVMHGDLTESERTQLLHALHRAVLAPVAAVFEEAKARGRVRADLDAELAASVVVSVVHGIGFAHLPAGETADASVLELAQRAVHAGIELVLRGATA